MSDIWEDRRVKIGYETAEELAKHYNPLNYRGHPDNQRNATEESLDALGYVGSIKKSLNSGVVLDGHLRIEIALAKDPSIQLPVDYYDLTPDEELLALQILDATTEMAEPIADKLAALMERTRVIVADKPGLAAMLDSLRARVNRGGEGNNPYEEWQGMPEFNQQDLTAYQSIHVHFKNQENVDRFAKLIGQKITSATRSTWYPKIEIERYADKRYSDES